MFYKPALARLQFEGLHVAKRRERAFGERDPRTVPKHTTRAMSNYCKFIASNTRAPPLDSSWLGFTPTNTANHRTQSAVKAVIDVMFWRLAGGQPWAQAYLNQDFPRSIMTDGEERSVESSPMGRRDFDVRGSVGRIALHCPDAITYIWPSRT